MEPHAHFFVYDRIENHNYISTCRGCGEVKLTPVQTNVPVISDPVMPSPWRKGDFWPQYPQVID